MNKNFITIKGKRYEGEISIEKDADSTWNLLLQIATDDGLGSVIIHRMMSGKPGTVRKNNENNSKSE